jgi:hypothetical protein
MFYLIVFVIPALFVFALGALLALVVSARAEDWLMGLGWDAHVLAWGALGGVFSNTTISHYFQAQGEAEAVELICVAALLLLAVLCLALRKKQPYAGWKVLCALALGGASLAVPAAIAFRANM